ncbi:Cdc14 phosphatase binding protein N-terminus-domain-containing protein [Lipomyces kononenkoae]
MTNTSGQLVRLQVHVGHNGAGGYLWSFDNPTVFQPTTSALLTGSPLTNYGSSGKKFIHITNPSTSIRKLKDELVSRYERIYHQSLDIESIRDEHECDLDDDYSVAQIFSDGGIVRVFTNNSLESASPLAASTKTPKNLRSIPPLTDVVLKSPSKSPEQLRNVSSASSRISASPEERKTKRLRIDDRQRSSSPELMVMDSQGQLVSGAEDSQPSPTRNAVKFQGRGKLTERKPNLGTTSGGSMLPQPIAPDVQRTPTKRVEPWAEIPAPATAATVHQEMEPAKLTTEVALNGAVSGLSPALKSEVVSTLTTAKRKRQNLAKKSPVNGVEQKSPKTVKMAAELGPATVVEEEDVPRVPMKISSPSSGSQSMSNGTTLAGGTHVTPTKTDALVMPETSGDDDGNKSEHREGEDATNGDIDSRVPKKSESADISHESSHDKYLKAKEGDYLQNDSVVDGEETNESGSDASDTEGTESTISSDSEQDAADSTKSEAHNLQNRTPTATGLQAAANRPPISPDRPVSLAGIVKAPLLEKRVPSFRSLSELAKLGVPEVRESTTGIRAIQTQIANDQKRVQTKTAPPDSGSDTDESSDSDNSGSSSDGDDDKSDDESGIPANRRASGVTKQEKEKKKRYSSGFRALFSM